MHLVKLCARYEQCQNREKTLPRNMSTVFGGKHEQNHSKPCAGSPILSFTILPTAMKRGELTLGPLGWCSWSCYMCNCGLVMKKDAELFSSWKHSQQNSFSEENRTKCHSIGSLKTLEAPLLQPFQGTQQQREEPVESPDTEVFPSCQGHRSPFSSRPSCLSQGLFTEVGLLCYPIPEGSAGCPSTPKEHSRPFVPCCHLHSSFSPSSKYNRTAWLFAYKAMTRVELYDHRVKILSRSLDAFL